MNKIIWFIIWLSAALWAPCRPTASVLGVE